MNNDTRTQYNAFLSQIAQLNQIEDATQKFNVTPNAEQKLVEKIQESSPFLSLVNSSMVDDQKGEKIGIGTNSTIAGRTDTSGDAERKTRAIHSTDSDGYLAEQTNYDTHVKYATLDQWRHQPNFQTLLRLTTSKQIARDRLMIAFNGKEVAKTTDRTANPLLQDVNIGWLEKLRQAKAEAVMDSISVGEAGDYKNLDALVMDAKNELIEPWHDGDDLVVICGRKLLNQKYFGFINDANVAIERKALESLMINKMLGGLRTIAVPFFPENSVFLTPLSNLSIYTQRNSTRLAYFDNPRKDQIEEFRSVNEAYVIEDYDACCLIENVTLGEEGA